MPSLQQSNILAAGRAVWAAQTACAVPAGSALLLFQQGSRQGSVTLSSSSLRRSMRICDVAGGAEVCQACKAHKAYSRGHQQCTQAAECGGVTAPKGQYPRAGTGQPNRRAALSRPM